MNKKLIVILPLGVIGLIVASIFIIPIIMYGGANVQVVSGTLTFESSKSTSLYSTQIGPGISNVNLELQNTSMSALNYAFSGIGGRNNAAPSNPSADISLELSIKMIISKNGTILKQIDIGAVHGEGEQEVTILFGPEEGFNEPGYYELSIVISLRLQTPGTTLELDIEIGPVLIYFNPQGES